MSTTTELQNMVLQFKVSDLQSLLGFAGQNKNGRKTELQKKALNLIQCRKSVPLEMKVRNIYKQLVAENAVNERRDDFYRPNYDKYTNYYVQNGYPNDTMSNGGYSSYNVRNCYPNSTDNYYNIWPSSNNGYSSNHIPPSVNNCRDPPSKFNYASYLEPNTRIPTVAELKNVVFKKLSFFSYKSCILALTPLVPRSEHSELFEVTLPFILNQQQHSFINWAKKSGKESRYQIQLRICLLDNNVVLDRTYEISDSLPLALGVKVNDKSCQLPPAIPSTNKQGMLLKRMNFPVNLTPQTRRSHSNNLVINWSVECNQVYGITIHLVEKYTSDELIDELKKNGERDPEVTKTYLNDKLNALGDDDIAATSLKVSLLCPLGKILMTLPVRATTCDHLQCFDGGLYIKMNEVKSTWQCPVCNKPCLYEDLFIDGYFANILRDGNFGSDVSEIQIEADGSVIPVLPPKKRNGSSPESNSPKKRARLEEPSSSKTNPNSTRNTSQSPETDRDTWPQNSLPHFNYMHSFSSGALQIKEDVDDGTHREQNKIDDQSSSPSPSSNESESSANKKNVFLIDLTETDSENEDCSSSIPLNLKRSNDASPSSMCSENTSKESPPIYDIDDSDNW